MSSKKALKIIIIFILSLVVIVIGAFTWWKLSLRAPDVSNDPHLPQISPLPTDEQGDVQDVPETPEPTEDLGENPENQSENRDGRYYTCLLVGMEYSASNTDVIIVARYDTQGDILNMVSIPRDTLVNVPYGNKKINAIYSNNNEDISALIDGVSQILGFNVDNYVVVDTDAFEDIIDAVGGVTYNVPVTMNYDDPTQDLSIHFEAGEQLLTGEDALKVIRFRQYPMGDIDRIAVQQDFMKTAIKQIVSLDNIFKVSELVDIVMDAVETDLTSANIRWYINEFLGLKMENVNFMTLPGNYTCSINGMSYVSIYLNDWLEMINTYLNPLTTDITESNCNIVRQLYPDDGNEELDPYNYPVTNGGYLAGGVGSFYKNY